MPRQQTPQKKLTQKQEPARLTGKLDKNLLAYTIAASAAGIGMMALTPAAEAEVIATQANIVIPRNGGLIEFDINKDGQMDFGLSIFSNLHTCTESQAKPHRRGPRRLLGCGPETYILRVAPVQAANEIWQAGTSFGEGPNKCAADLIGGVRIGPPRPFGTGSMVMSGLSGSSRGFSFCPWRGGHPPKPFLGVKFVDTSGNTHYGWVRVSRTGDSTIITGYAYETIPNKAIVAGVTHGSVTEAGLIDPAGEFVPNHSEPASLGMLALGAPGLAAWRRQDQDEALPVK
jgi:hypothetical protein